MATDSTVAKTKLRALNARILFAHGLRKASALEDGGTPKYGVCLVFDTAAQKDPAFKALRAAVNEKVGEIVGVPQNKIRTPFRSSDDEEKTGQPGFEPGSLFINVSSKDKPLVVDQARNELSDDEIKARVLSGYYVNALLGIYTYGADANARKKTKGNAGVAFGLQAVQLVRKGDVLSGRASASDFDAIETTEGEDVEELLS